MDRCHVTGRLKITNNLTFYARLLCAHPFRRTWASSFNKKELFPIYTTNILFRFLYFCSFADDNQRPVV